MSWLGLSLIGHSSPASPIPAREYEEEFDDPGEWTFQTQDVDEARHPL